MDKDEITSLQPISFNNETHLLTCQGDWDIEHLEEFERALTQLPPVKKQVAIHGAGINKMDTAGAWLLTQWKNKWQSKGIQVTFTEFSESSRALLSLIEKKDKEITPPKPITSLNPIEKIGKSTILALLEIRDFLIFVGQLAIELFELILTPSRWRVQSLASVIYRNGYQALPIIALLSFMIGVVLAYQMGMQLRNYGANIYIVDLLGLSILREFGPLLTAIIVAGRTGSAFTAQLGTMKINQEIDALNTMGVTPAELLILPRVFGLLIVLPLLSIWADGMGVIGGMVMAQNMLGILPYDFLNRFYQVIPLRALLVGLGKTPVFALIIASIGCFQGMRVEKNADSVGLNTTKSVVLGIFFIIISDAVFSVIFSKLKL